MDWTIAAVLLLDGIGNGAVYALLGMAIVLVFAVTRVILIPQGEFVAYSALTLAMLQLGKRAGHRLARVAAGRADLVARAVGRLSLERAWSVLAWRSAACAPCPWPPRRSRGSPAAMPGPSCARRAHAGARDVHRAAGLAARVPAGGRRVGAAAADRLGRRALHAGRPGARVLRRRRLPHAAVLGRQLRVGAHHCSRASPSSRCWRRRC